MIQFEEWFEAEFGMKPRGAYWDDDMMLIGYKAGYNQRSQEVAEDMKLLENILSHVDTEH